MSIDGLSRAAMKPQLCQYRSASASIARTTTARPPTKAAPAMQRVLDQAAADALSSMAVVDGELFDQQGRIGPSPGADGARCAV